MKERFEMNKRIKSQFFVLRFVSKNKQRKRYSWNPSMFRGLEHPSGFPSMLRGSTPEPRPLSRRDSYGSSNQLRRDSNGATTPTPSALHRKDSSSGTNGAVNRHDSAGTNYLQRKDSNGSVLSRKDSTDGGKSIKRDNLNDDFRRLSFGTSIYLRPDSSGATNLIRRDSFGRRDSTTKLQRHPRDYVSKLFDYKPSTTTISLSAIVSPSKDTHTTSHTNSILRKTDDSQTNKENHDLTTANLSKHVTIWEKDGDDGTAIENGTSTGRRDSSGSLGNSLASRRISVDSLDLRRNSRRGSSASGDINLNAINDESNEVTVLFGLFLLDNTNKQFGGFHCYE